MRSFPAARSRVYPKKKGSAERGTVHEGAVQKVNAERRFHLRRIGL